MVEMTSIGCAPSARRRARNSVTGRGAEISTKEIAIRPASMTMRGLFYRLPSTKLRHARARGRRIVENARQPGIVIVVSAGSIWRKPKCRRAPMSGDIIHIETSMPPAFFSVARRRVVKKLRGANINIDAGGAA